MAVFQLIILDLATDSSDVTIHHLKSFVKSQQDSKIWPENLHTICLPDENDAHVIKQQHMALAVISCLFEAKNRFDAENKTDFVLVTSLYFKKFWEEVCHVLFSPVHNWMVYGLIIPNQPFDNFIHFEQDISSMVKEFLTTVGNPEDIEILRPKNIPADIFNAGFSTRLGGVSSLSPVASLNLLYISKKVDSNAIIEENRRRLAVRAGFDHSSVYVAKVEHATTVRVIERKLDKDDITVRYDCLVTNTPGVTLFAPGADCSPILLADVKTGACGAVHAGWKGTVKGAVRQALKTMVEEYGTNPSDVKAAIGPSVETRCFKLSTTDAQPLTDLSPSLTPPCVDEPGYVNPDLVQANVIWLEQDGVLPENIDTTWAVCTRCHSERFFSHQRDRFPFGNQVGFISCTKRT